MNESTARQPVPGHGGGGGRRFGIARDMILIANIDRDCGRCLDVIVAGDQFVLRRVEPFGLVSVHEGRCPTAWKPTVIDGGGEGGMPEQLDLFARPGLEVVS